MDPIVIKLGGYQGPGSINTRAGSCFGEVLQQKLGDRVSFELVADVLALGRKSGDLPNMVESGELALCYISTVRFSPVIHEMTLLELPFVVRERSNAIRALLGPLGGLFKQRMLERTPFRALGFWDNGFRHITNSVRPIHTPADCKGLRIRTQMSELHGEALTALGFQPIPVDIKEFVEQIGTGRFQAQENPLTNTFNFGVHHFHRYLTLTGHFFGASAFVCNETWYSTLPADVREAVDAAAHAATTYQHKLAAAEDDAILGLLDPRENEVIRLSAAEQDAFVLAVAPMRARHRKNLDPRLFEYLA